MTTQENNELEQMRRQMAILQGKLDKETIVNKRLMRESMKNSYSSINSFLKFQQADSPLLVQHLASKALFRTEGITHQGIFSNKRRNSTPYL